MTELELLEKLRAQPIIYIGRKTLTGLVHFSSGFIEGALACGVTIPEDTTKAMQEYVREWYEIPGQFHWSRILLMACNSEEAAFDAFFELLDHYRQGVDPKTRIVPDD